MPQPPNHSQNGSGISSLTSASGGWGLAMDQTYEVTSEVPQVFWLLQLSTELEIREQVVPYLKTSVTLSGIFHHKVLSDMLQKAAEVEAVRQMQSTSR